MRPLGNVDDPVRVSLRALVRTTYRVEWEYDGSDYDEDGQPNPRRKVQVRSFFSKGAAYQWIARKLIFVRRDKLAKGPDSPCSLCEAMPAWDPENGPALCRYHDTVSFHAIARRLARWLRWRDSVRARAG
jgi:hypothetical protein